MQFMIDKYAYHNGYDDFFTNLIKKKKRISIEKALHDNYSKLLTKIEIFDFLYQNRYFSKFLSKIDIFVILDQNRNVSKTWIEIEIF